MELNKAVQHITQYSDTEIIQRVLQGDVAFFELIIRRYNPFLYRIGRSYNFNHQDTEDLMQETYLNTFTHLSKFENRSSFKTWIARIIINQCYQKRRKFSFLNEVLSDIEPYEKNTPMFHNAMNTEKQLLNKELGKIIEKAIGNIAEEYRIVFILRELNGMSVSDTADVLRISESNVKVRLNRAKKMLKTQIEKMYSADEVFEFNLIYCDSMVHKVMQGIIQLMA